MTCKKPQTPLQHKDGDYFYPLTTIDQVIMEDGLTRLSGADLVSISTDGAPEGEVAKINAELLDGRPSSDYVLKTDAMVVTKNYSVVGGMDEPTIPTKNMIWVQTENNTIGKVHFSGIEPSSVNDNDIWIYTGDNSSVVAFDAIKIGNDTMNTIYPISAKQYVSGAWVDVTAKSYQNGEWVDWWNGELYDSGDEFTNITGGWVAVGLKTYSQGSSTAGAPTVTKNGSSVTLTQASTRTGAFHTANKIKLTGKTQLLFWGSATNKEPLCQQIMVWDALPTYWDKNVVASATIPKESSMPINVDLSDVPAGEYYVGIFIYQTNTITMTKMLLE